VRLKKVLKQVEGRELHVLFHRHLFVAGLDLKHLIEDLLAGRMDSCFFLREVYAGAEDDWRSGRLEARCGA
jgi:hypothetical protein